MQAGLLHRSIHQLSHFALSGSILLRYRSDPYRSVWLAVDACPQLSMGSRAAQRSLLRSGAILPLTTAVDRTLYELRRPLPPANKFTSDTAELRFWNDGFERVRLSRLGARLATMGWSLCVVCWRRNSADTEQLGEALPTLLRLLQHATSQSTAAWKYNESPVTPATASTQLPRALLAALAFCLDTLSCPTARPQPISGCARTHWAPSQLEAARIDYVVE